MVNKHDFSFAMTVAKAEGEETPEGVIKTMRIKGVASNTRRDLEDHQFTVQGLESIKKAIEDGLVDEDGDWSQIPLRSGHRGEWEDVLGYVTHAEIDDQQNLWITAELDPDSSKARELYIKVSKGNVHGRKAKLGLSVKGQTTKYHFGMDPEAKRRVTYLDNLLVEEISVTQKPKNPTPYSLAIVKSILADEELEQSMTEELDITKGEDVREHPALVKTEEELAEEAANAAAEAAAHQHVSNESEAPVQEVTTEPVVAEPNQNADLVAQISALTQLVQSLQADVAAIKNQPTSVQKAIEDEPVVTAESVLPQQDENLDQKISVAVTKAFSDLGIASQITNLQTVLDTLSQQAQDKSFSVSKAKDDEDSTDPTVIMNKLIEEGADPLAAAFTTLRQRQAAKS